MTTFGHFRPFCAVVSHFWVILVFFTLFWQIVTIFVRRCQVLVFLYSFGHFAEKFQTILGHFWVILAIFGLFYSFLDYFLGNFHNFWSHHLVLVLLAYLQHLAKYLRLFWGIWNILGYFWPFLVHFGHFLVILCAIFFGHFVCNIFWSVCVQCFSMFGQETGCWYFWPHFVHLAIFG